MQRIMDTLAQEFLLYLQAERGCSHLTAAAYRSDLQQFLMHLQENYPVSKPDEVTVDMVRSWIVGMHHRGLSNNSVARRICALKSFWKYVCEQDLASPMVMGKVSTPGREKTLPLYLNKDDLRKLLDAALQQRTAFCAFRDHAIMATFIYGGLRRGELLNLKVGDVDLSEGTLWVVRGKGKKTRIIPMVDELKRAIADWLEYRPPCGHGYLFTTNRGNRIHPSRMQII